MLIILAQIYVFICILFLAGKDATSYLLKNRDISGSLIDSRIHRWHRDGVALNILIITPIVYLRPELSWIILYTLLIRLCIFDLAFNKWSGLNYKYLGSTAWSDKLMIKVFGENGAIKKSIFFFVLLVLLNFIIN